MDETRAIQQAIKERRSAPSSTVLNKDLDPAPLTKADGDAGLISGYDSRWWVVDSYGECTAPGCFAVSIRDRGPKAATPRIMLRYEHAETIGTYRALDEDGDGLISEAYASDDGMYGSVVRAHLRDGVPYGKSIGFRRVQQREATEADPLDFSSAPAYIKTLAAESLANIIVLTETKLLESSVVTFPAVDTALITNYRSVLDLTQRSLDALMRDAKAGRLTDDHLTHLRRIAASVPAANDPEPGETPAPVETQTALTRGRNYHAEAAYALMCVEA